MNRSAKRARNLFPRKYRARGPDGQKFALACRSTLRVLASRASKEIGEYGICSCDREEDLAAIDLPAINPLRS